MNVLVTGGAGFIGSNLTDALLTAGHTVRVLDNFSTGSRVYLNPAAEISELDFTQLEAIRPAFVGMDTVFHVGALPRVPLSIAEPQKTHLANVDGTLNILIASRDAKVRRVIYSASSSAYGEQASLPLKEDMRPNPMNPYALQKFVGEEYCRLFSSLYGLETVSLRYFNVYGPRMATQGAYVTVISVFRRQKSENQMLTIVGDGEQTRDFTHVSDVVAANLAAMTSLKVGHGEVINIGAGEPHSVNEIAKFFGGHTSYLPPRPEARHTFADITRAKQLLGWEPRVKFWDGVAQLLTDG